MASVVDPNVQRRRAAVPLAYLFLTIGLSASSVRYSFFPKDNSDLHIALTQLPPPVYEELDAASNARSPPKRKAWTDGDGVQSSVESSSEKPNKMPSEQVSSSTGGAADASQSERRSLRINEASETPREEVKSTPRDKVAVALSQTLTKDTTMLEMENKNIAAHNQAVSEPLADGNESQGIEDQAASLDNGSQQAISPPIPITNETTRDENFSSDAPPSNKTSLLYQGENVTYNMSKVPASAMEQQINETQPNQFEAISAPKSNASIRETLIHVVDDIDLRGNASLTSTVIMSMNHTTVAASRNSSRYVPHNETISPVSSSNASLPLAHNGTTSKYVKFQPPVNQTSGRSNSTSIMGEKRKIPSKPSNRTKVKAISKKGEKSKPTNTTTASTKTKVRGAKNATKAVTPLATGSKLSKTTRPNNASAVPLVYKSKIETNVQKVLNASLDQSSLATSEALLNLTNATHNEISAFQNENPENRKNVTLSSERANRTRTVENTVTKGTHPSSNSTMNNSSLDSENEDIQEEHGNNESLSVGPLQDEEEVVLDGGPIYLNSTGVVVNETIASPYSFHNGSLQVISSPDQLEGGEENLTKDENLLPDSNDEPEEMVSSDEDESAAIAGPVALDDISVQGPPVSPVTNKTHNKRLAIVAASVRALRANMTDEELASNENSALSTDESALGESSVAAAVKVSRSVSTIDHPHYARVTEVYEYMANNTKHRGYPWPNRQSPKHLCPHVPVPERDPSVTSSVEYIGCCGLGHRLARMANAAYLAMELKTSLYGHWNCCGEQEVFSSLFGSEPIQLTEIVPRPVDAPQHLQFRFEVPGFKISKNWALCPTGQKRIGTDYKFYHKLRENYVRHTRVMDFVKKNFDGKYVIGVHIRAGNGESGDFVKKRRIIADKEAFIRDLSSELRRVALNAPSPPVVFVATDTPSYLEALRAALNATVPVVDFQQDRPEEGSGILFGEMKYVVHGGDHCLEGWHSAIMDMFILSYSEALIASKVSSFTETLPLSLVMGNPKRRTATPFCEYLSGKLRCYSSIREWSCRTINRKPTHFDVHPSWKHIF